MMTTSYHDLLYTQRPSPYVVRLTSLGSSIMAYHGLHSFVYNLSIHQSLNSLTKATLLLYTHAFPAGTQPSLYTPKLRNEYNFSLQTPENSYNNR